MKTWRDEVIGRLGAAADHFTVAADPDELLIEERMLQRIEEIGFDVITFDDHVAFRFAFESSHRTQADRAGGIPRRILIRTRATDPSELPFDVLARGRRMSLSLEKLFPALSYPVVASLNRGDLDNLFSAQQDSPPGRRLGTARPGTTSCATLSGSPPRRSPARRIFSVSF